MSQKQWGFRFNEQPDYEHLGRGEKPAGCPDWFESQQIHTWQERGLVIWSNAAKRIEVLEAAEALRVLGQLQTSDPATANDVSVKRLVHEIEIPMPPRGRRRKNELRPQAETGRSEAVYREILHLPAEAGSELIEFLRTNESTLTAMAQEDEKHRREAWAGLFQAVLKWSREAEQCDINFAGRSFEWQRLEERRWSCRLDFAEGRICLDKNQWWWHACIQRVGIIARSYYATKMQEAVDWVEKELPELANQPEESARPAHKTEEEIRADRLRLQRKLMGGPYWINPSVMEPTHSTYQLLIDMDAEPSSYKTSESICGITYRHQERYLSPAKMAQVLRLDIDAFYVVQPAGDNTEWYRITSVTEYYQEASAAQQAQATWDQSLVAQQFKAGAIRRARYGYQEVETGYEVFLGACQRPDDHWWGEESKPELMQMRALEESLSFALDVNDFRDYLGLSVESISNDKLLRCMHGTRAHSKYLPEEINRESRVWLAQHDPAE